MTPTDPTRPEWCDALDLPLDRIRWAQNTMPRPTEGELANLRPRRGRIAAAIAAVTVAGCATAAGAAPQRPTLDPTLQCDVYTVAAGDWMSHIAMRNGLTPQELIARNPHIPDPNRIWPGDQVVLRCTPRKPVIAPATTAPAVTTPPTTAAPKPELEINAVQVAPKPAPTVDWPGANPFIPGEQIVDGVASQGLILRALHNPGARGNQLIGLAAVTECESNRRLNAEGDHELRDNTWDVSLSPWQVRGAKGQQGKGTARDVDALRADPIGHGAAAAVEIYDAALTAGRDPLAPWTCHLNRNDRSFVAPYTELARQMGMLG